LQPLIKTSKSPGLVMAFVVICGIFSDMITTHAARFCAGTMTCGHRPFICHAARLGWLRLMLELGMQSSIGEKALSLIARWRERDTPQPHPTSRKAPHVIPRLPLPLFVLKSLDALLCAGILKNTRCLIQDFSEERHFS
jgi:hypothetical protein